MADNSPPISLVRGGLAQSVIVLGDRPTSFERWLAGEIQRYCRALAGDEPPILLADDPPPRGRTRILLGNPARHGPLQAAGKAGLIDPRPLPPESFVLRTVSARGWQGVLVAAGDESGLMHATYDFLGRLGVVFTLTGDNLPQRRPDLDLPALDIRWQPPLRYRGLHARHFLMPWIGLSDYRRLLDQLAKLKCNYLELFFFLGAGWAQPPLRPVVEPRTTLTGWNEYDALAEVDRATRRLLHQIIEYAHTRRIQVWLGNGDAPSPHGPADPAGAPADAAALPELSAAIRQLASDYPEADGYWLWLNRPIVRATPAEAEHIVRQADLRHRLPSREQMQGWREGRLVQSALSPDELLAREINLLHSARLLTDSARRALPAGRLGVAMQGRSFLLPALDALLPAEIALQSMETRRRDAPATATDAPAPAGVSPLPLAAGREMFLVPPLVADLPGDAAGLEALWRQPQLVIGRHTIDLAGLAGALDEPKR